jgi:hypothetical protein
MHISTVLPPILSSPLAGSLIESNLDRTHQVSSHTRPKRSADELLEYCANWNPPEKAARIITAADRDDPTDGITDMMHSLTIQDEMPNGEADRCDAEHNATIAAAEHDARELRRLDCLQFELDTFGHTAACVDIVNTTALGPPFLGCPGRTQQPVALPEVAADVAPGLHARRVSSDELENLRTLLEISDDGCRVLWPVGWDELSVRELVRKAYGQRT